MKKRLKKLLVLGMCTIMVGSTGAIVNAASGSFDFYVDYPSNNNYSSKISKTGTNSQATINITTCLTSNHNGHYGKVRKDSTDASGVFNITGAKTYKPYYSSGYAKSGTGYNFYAYTSSSAAAGMTLKGTWTP